MSEHKTGKSNYTPDQKKGYWKRRNTVEEVKTRNPKDQKVVRVHKRRLRGQS